jgi:hypothetical protein
MISDLIVERETLGAPPFTLEFRSYPEIEWRDDGSVDIHFEGTSESRLWKDWFVFLSQRLAISDACLAFEGFVDLISGQFRPARLPLL